MREESKFGIWSNNNYFAFIAEGKKIWRSISHSYSVGEGDIIFVKKGANLTHQFFDDTFCAIFIFIPDDFIKGFLNRNNHLLESPQKDLDHQDSILRVDNDQLLDAFRYSIQSYLSLPETPSKQLLELKFEELLLSLFSKSKHKGLTDYFVSLCQNQQYLIKRVMEENFSYNLQLKEYAVLCHMSLSSFKKWFRLHYNATPAQWLKDKKLELAYTKTVQSDLSISQIAFECGFEDPSHFIRVFKEKYALTPLQLRRTIPSPVSF
ncbi:MAG: AraC family transcriptional regulator [Flavitalea sp.]